MKIIIQGIPGEGKTTMALLIADALAHAGLDFELIDPDVINVDAALANPLQGQRASALRNRDYNIIIETVQTSKSK